MTSILVMLSSLRSMPIQQCFHSQLNDLEQRFCLLRCCIPIIPASWNKEVTAALSYSLYLEWYYCAVFIMTRKDNSDLHGTWLDDQRSLKHTQMIDKLICTRPPNWMTSFCLSMHSRKTHFTSRTRLFACTFQWQKQTYFIMQQHFVLFGWNTLWHKQHWQKQIMFFAWNIDFSLKNMNSVNSLSVISINLGGLEVVKLFKP